MAVFVAVLFVVAKALVVVLAGLLLVVVFLLVLPVRATVRGECAVEGDLDSLLEAAETEVPDTPEPVITIMSAGLARATVLGGLLGVEYHTDDRLKVLLAGVPAFRITPGGKARSKAPPAGEQEVVALERSHPEKGRRKRGFLRALDSRRSSRAKDRSESAGKKKGLALSVKVKEAQRWVAPEARQMVLTTVKRLLKVLRLRGHVHAECGFGDPGVTGMTYATFVMWSGMTRQRWLTFKPNFVDSLVFLRVEGETRFLPVQVAYVVGRFLLSREIRPLWRKKRARESRKAPALGAHISG